MDGAIQQRWATLTTEQQAQAQSDFGSMLARMSAGDESAGGQIIVETSLGSIVMAGNYSNDGERIESIIYAN